MSNLTVNSFRAFLSSSLQKSGNENIIYIDRITTLTGETIQTSDFSVFGRGTITIDPLSSTDIEFASFTGVDGTAISLTGSVRGLSAKGNASSTTRMPYHPVSTPVIISFGVHNIEDLITYINGVLAGSIGTASKTVAGITKMTENMAAQPRSFSALVSQLSSPGLTLTVQPFAISDQSTDIDFAGGTSPTFTAPVGNPRLDLLVYDTLNSILAIRSGTVSASPVKPSPSNGDIVLAQVYNRVGQTSILEQDDTVNGYIKRWYIPALYLSAIPSGAELVWPTYVAPAGWVLEDGTAYSRTGIYANLFNVLCPSGTFTVTIASPAVFTKTAHGYLVNDKLHFTTTGGLPTGLLINTDYYITSVTTNTFQVALSPGGPAINTTGSQTGVHTVYRTFGGKGDGVSTFAVPDARGKGRRMIGTATMNLLIDSANISGNNFTVPNGDFPYQGQAVIITTSGTLPTGLTPGTTYYIIRNSTTSISFAPDLSSSVNGSKITLSGTPVGVHTITYTSPNTRTNVGVSLGQDLHGQSLAEMPNHFHYNNMASGGSGGGAGLAQGNGFTTAAGNGTQYQGNSQEHNIMAPDIIGNWIIKL